MLAGVFQLNMKDAILQTLHCEKFQKFLILCSLLSAASLLEAKCLQHIGTRQRSTECIAATARMSHVCLDTAHGQLPQRKLLVTRPRTFLNKVSRRSKWWKQE